MWQRTLLLLKYRSFWVRLCSTGLHALPSFCSKPPLLDLASPHRPVTRDEHDDKERDCRRESEKCPSSQSAVSICVPLEAVPAQSSQIRGGLRDCILMHPLLVLPWLEIGDGDLAWRALSLTSTGAPASPLPCHKIFLSVRSPSQQVHVHSQ